MQVSIVRQSIESMSWRHMCWGTLCLEICVEQI